MKSIGFEVAQPNRLPGHAALLSSVSHRVLVAALMGLMASFPVRAQSGLPTGGTVVSGGGTISQSGNTLNINQPGQTGIYNFQTFSIGAGNTVNFNQPNSSASSLARVLGTESSLIGGALNAKGSVMLINPNGIAITSTGVINVGSFTASTLDIKDSDFLAGKYKFTGNGGSAGVSNAGRINVSDGGFAALLGGQVSNSGTITARLGKVGLGAGEMITLDFAGDGFLSVAVPSSQLGKLVDPNGALVTNSGRIRANGGTVMLSAATAAGVLRDAVNVPGSIRANSVGTHNGKIVIGGGAGGRVNVTGKLAASGINKKKPGKSVAGGVIEVTGGEVNLSGSVNVSGTTGGTVNVQSGQGLNVGGTIAATGRTGVAGAIELTGTNISISGGISANGATGGSVIGYATGSLLITGTLQAKGLVARGGAISVTSADVKLVGAKLDASGATGGGKIQIGGGYQGTGSLAHSLNVVIDPASVIRADATLKGDGGTVIVWSDGSTKVAGTLTARGAGSGNGGLIETSGRNVDFTGIRVDASSARGKAGLWLIDPTDLIIDATAAATIGSVLNTGPSGTNVLLETSANNAPSSPAGNTASGDGDIIVNSDMTWSTGASLTLSAFHSVILNAAINITGPGGLVVNTNNNVGGTSSGTGAFTIAIDNGGRGRVDYGPTDNGGTLSINGTPYTLVYTATQFDSIDGVLADGLNTGVPVYGAGLNGNYALATSVGNFGAAGALIKVPPSFAFFDGKFEGLGNSFFDFNISGGSGFVALFGGINASGVVRDLKISQCATCRVQGFASDTVVAPLAAQNYGLIANVAVEGSGSVTGMAGSSVAGLVGFNAPAGRIINSHSTLNVRAAPTTPLQAFIGNAFLGGLVAINTGTIANSYATGNVSGGDQSLAGGLVGYSWLGSLTNVYATGSVNINPGVVGSGAVIKGFDYNVTSAAGGLVGDLEGTTITNAYATGSVSARDGASAGGLAGFVVTSTITNAYATGSVTTLGSSNAGGLVGRLGFNGNSATVTNAYATGAISAGTGSLVGGLVGRLDSGTVTNGYWNKDTTGQTTSAGGGTPLTTAEMTDLTTFRTTYAGFDFNNVWSPPNQAGQGGNATANTPQLYALSNVIWVDAADVSRTYGDSNPTLTYALHGLQSGDSASIVTGVSLTGPAATANVGIYAIDAGSPQATGTNGVAYRFVNTGDVTVTQRALSNSVTITGIDKVYDGNATAPGGSVNLTASNNVVSGDVVTLSSAGGTYASADVSGVVNVGLTGVTLSNSNYSFGTLSYAGAGSITPKTLTVALTGTVSKTYDGTTTATLADANYTALSGVIAGDAGSVAVNHPTSGNYSDANASAVLKTVTVDGLQLSGLKAGNYTIANSVSGTIGRIDQRQLMGNAAITGIDKTYDSTTVAAGGSANLTAANNVVAGDTVTLLSGSGTYDSANAGARSVTLNAITLSNSNYAIGGLSASGSGTISPAALTVTAATDTKVYDGNASSAGTPTITTGQLYGTDTANFTQVFASRNVLGANNSILIASGPVSDGNSGNNYTVTYQTAQGTITAAPLTIGAVADSRTYNGTTSSTGVPVTVAGLVGGDTIAGFTQAFTSKNVQGANVSTLAVNAGSGTVNDGNSGNNYSVSYQTAQGTITAAPLTITAATDNRVYNGTASSSGAPTVTSGQIFAGDTGNFTQAFDSKNVQGTNGSTLTASGSVSDTNGGNNYAVLFNTTQGTITPAPLTITAATDNRIYNGTTSSSGVPTVTSGQIFAGDTGNFTQAFASKNVQGANNSTLNASGSVSDTNGGNNYTVQFNTAQGTITPAPLTVTAATDTKVYDSAVASSGAPTVTSGQIFAGDTGNFTQVYTSKNAQGVNGSTLAASGSVSDGNSGNNYAIQFNATQGTITPAPLTITAAANTKTYDGTTTAAAAPTVSGLVGLDTVTGLAETYANANAGTGKTINVTAYTVNDGNGGANYAVQTVASVAGIITAATLTYVADAASRAAGTSNPVFTGTVTGFKNNETLASATTGALAWISPADATSSPGGYAINGSGLSALNYVFVQAPGNATALTITPVNNNNPTSQANPPPNNPTTPGVNITFQNTQTGPANVSFTTGANQRTASTTTDVNTAGGPSAVNRSNNGFTYQPISVFEPNQYSQIQVPDYADKAGLAAIFTMIGRATQPNNASDFMIDGFWTGSDAAWSKGSDGKPIANRVTFSDGADKTVSPAETNANGFPVEAGKTDLLAMLGKGPVILGGSGTPAVFLLAIKASDDGKGIIANDPISGRQVLLSYDAGTKTVGGVTGIFDAKTQKFVALSEASATQQAGEPALKADSLAPLNDFKPVTFFAVAVK